MTLPWGKIIIAIVIAAALWFVVSYIRTAEKNKDLVVTQKAQIGELTEANAAMKKEYDNQLQVLQGTILKKEEREKQYETAINEIQNQPDSGCARTSQPIRASLRLLRADSSD